MKKILIMVFLIFILSMPIINAEERDSECGSAEAWVKLDGGEWQEAGIYNVSLDIYEEFKVRITAKTKVLCHVDVLISGAGGTVTFEVIDGPLEYDEWRGEMNVPEGETRTFESTVRPTDNKFVGGNTPLSVNIQFTPPHWEDDICHVKFGLINPHINNKIWDGYTEPASDDNSDAGESENGQNNVKNDSPGFEIILFLLVLGLVLYYKKIKT